MKNTENHEKIAFETISRRVIGAAIEVHRELGPGLLESAYEACLAHELKSQGYRVETQKPLPVHYKGLDLEVGYRMDLVVESTLLVELKSVQTLERVHEAQVLTYLKLSGLKTALLINFNVPILKEGLRRMVK